MVRLWSAVGYRVRIPDLTDKIVDDLRTYIHKEITPVWFVEKLRLSNHLAIIVPQAIVPEGIASKLEEYLKYKGWNYLRADVHVRTRLKWKKVR